MHRTWSTGCHRSHATLCTIHSCRMKSLDVASMLIVGAFWGCTNPWIRRGALETATGKTSQPAESKHKRGSDTTTTTLFLLLPSWFQAWLGTDTILRRFLDYRVWLPYALNQAGSGVYYFLLSSSDLTLAVPICNGLALVFSCITSSLLGERVDKPGRAILGAALVMMGTGLCMMVAQVAQEDQQQQSS